MKQYLTILFTLAALSLSAAPNIVWTGNEPISWNTDVYQGSQFETPEGIFAGLRASDTILVSVVAHIEEPQYVLTYKAGVDWSWTDLSVTLNDSLISYIVESETIATEIAERGLIFRGQGYNITSIAFTSQPQDTTPVIVPDTNAIDFSALYEKVLWTGNQPISWNSSEYAGDKLDTYAVQQDLFAGLQAGHVIAVYVTPDGDAQYALKYKVGDDWTWTELPLNTATPGILAFRVPDDDTAQLIADRGLVVDGIRFALTKISLFADTQWQTALHNTSAQLDPNAPCYNLLGQPVTAGYKGIVIQNGHKFILQQ